VLPNGLIVQRVQGDRLTRTIWKIVRGLFAGEHRRFLPEDKARSIQLRYLVRGVDCGLRRRRGHQHRADALRSSVMLYGRGCVSIQ